jgi:DtxR family Mn-dependent transcriptional regulator
MGIGPKGSLRVVKQNYDQTVSIELPAGICTLGRPAAEAVWLRAETKTITKNNKKH